MQDHYPYLADLLGSWFHQDFDVDGDVPDIIPKFVTTVDAPAAWAVVADIRRFQHRHAKDLDAAFLRVFKPDIRPEGWNKTTAEWLAWIEGLLVASLR